jgi:hypothetical protein
MRYGFYFVATSIGLVAAYFLIGGVATGIIALGVAELLIRRARLGGSGVDAALWLGGLVALIAAIPSHGQPEGLLLIAAAAAVAGARVRNPWFGGLAVAVVLFYLDQKHLGAATIAAIAQAIAVAAALLRARTWRLESTDRLFGAMAVAAPLTQYREVWPIDLAGGAIVLIIAIRLRDRMLLVAAAVSIAIAATDFGHRADVAVEWELIVAGVALVAIAVAVTRALRGRASGIVLTPGPKSHYEDVATMWVGLSSPTGRVGEPAPHFSGGGGDAGGGGATETF